VITACKAAAALARHPAIASGIGQFAAVQAAAPSMGMELSPVDVREATEIERAITTFARAERQLVIAI
jgi:putative ABC transport system substrate-binding protein